MWRENAQRSLQQEGGRAMKGRGQSAHHNVGGVKVDAQASGTGGQQEDELLAALRIEAINLRLSVLSGGVTCAWSFSDHAHLPALFLHGVG